MTKVEKYSRLLFIGINIPIHVVILKKLLQNIIAYIIMIHFPV